MDKKAFFARTMHTPDDPPRAQMRAALRELSQTLLPLHRALIEAAKSDYGFTVEPVTGPTHLLRLLGDDPFFAWLKPITALIVDIDEMVRVDFEAAEAAKIASRVKEFFNGNGGDFATHYVPILQRDVDVAIAHAAVRLAVGRLVAALPEEN
jgi:hypothetical protein